MTGCHKGGASAWLQLADPSPVWLFPTITWTCWYALVLSGRFHPQEPKRDTNERYFASSLACQGRSITLWNSGTPWLNSSFTELADLIKPTSNHWSGPRSLPHVWTVTNQINNESVMTLFILNPQATVARILRDSFFFFFKLLNCIFLHCDSNPITFVTAAGAGGNRFSRWLPTLSVFAVEQRSAPLKPSA